VEVQVYAFLTSALDCCEWSASHPSRFTPREMFSSTQWKGSWVGPGAGVDVVAKKISPDLPGIESGRPTIVKEFL